MAHSLNATKQKIDMLYFLQKSWTCNIFNENIIVAYRIKYKPFKYLQHDNKGLVLQI